MQQQKAKYDLLFYINMVMTIDCSKLFQSHTQEVIVTFPDTTQTHKPQLNHSTRFLRRQTYQHWTGRRMRSRARTAREQGTITIRSC